MKSKRRQESFDGDAGDSLRPLERHNFCLIGIVPGQVIDLGRLFEEGDRDRLSKELREEAGIPWSRAFEDMWDGGEAEARRKGLFDLTWHRRALAIDPVVNAPDFTGFDVLLNIARQAVPELGELLSFVDGNEASNPRRAEGPDWWSWWHQATGSRSGGWLSSEEAAEVHHVLGDERNRPPFPALAGPDRTLTAGELERLDQAQPVPELVHDDGLESRPA